jgi:hypothetical protein
MTACAGSTAFGLVAAPAQAVSPTSADLYVLHAVPAHPSTSAGDSIVRGKLETAG